MPGTQSAYQDHIDPHCQIQVPFPISILCNPSVISNRNDYSFVLETVSLLGLWDITYSWFSYFTDWLFLQSSLLYSPNILNLKNLEYPKDNYSKQKVLVFGSSKFWAHSIPGILWVLFFLLRAPFVLDFSIVISFSLSLKYYFLKEDFHSWNNRCLHLIVSIVQFVLFYFFQFWDLNHIYPNTKKRFFFPKIIWNKTNFLKFLIKFITTPCLNCFIFKNNLIQCWL